MPEPREKEPFIQKGDQVTVGRGWGQGKWDVLAARWAAPDEADHRVELVLSRGSAKCKRIFDEAAMRHQSRSPDHILARDIRIGKPLRLRPK